MEKLPSYDVSNFIVRYCENEEIAINNLKLNGILAFIYYNSKRVYGFNFIEEKPVRGRHFYVVKEVYERFRHKGAESVGFLPGDFNFTTLLSNDILEEDIKRHSDEMSDGIAKVESTIGIYIEVVVRELSQQDIFTITEAVDLECDALL